MPCTPAQNLSHVGTWVELENSLRHSLSHSLNFIGGQRVYDFDVIFDPIALVSPSFRIATIYLKSKTKLFCVDDIVQCSPNLALKKRRELEVCNTDGAKM